VRRSEKEEMVALLHEAVEAAESLIMTGYSGLSVKDLTALRREVRQAGGRMQVVKKTLLLRALEGRDEAGISEHMEGPIALTFVSGDPTPVLKSIREFARTHEELEFRGGWVDSQVVSAAQLTEIASLPPREELLARLLFAVKGPLSGLVATLQAVPRDLALTLQALSEKRAGEAAA
jgi:large subunit ribosomal protein L10